MNWNDKFIHINQTSFSLPTSYGFNLHPPPTPHHISFSSIIETSQKTSTIVALKSQHFILHIKWRTTLTPPTVFPPHSHFSFSWIYNPNMVQEEILLQPYNFDAQISTFYLRVRWPTKILSIPNHSILPYTRSIEKRSHWNYLINRKKLYSISNVFFIPNHFLY